MKDSAAHARGYAMDYVPILNRDKGTVECVLLGPPQSVTMHWDQEAKRTQLCTLFLLRLQGEDPPTSACAWCEKEKEVRGYIYCPCAFPQLKDEIKQFVAALIQLPLGFVSQNREKLQAGRWIRVEGMNIGGRQPFWKCTKLIDPPCQSFDVVEALMRIKGVSLNKAAKREKEGVLQFRRQA